MQPDPRFSGDLVFLGNRLPDRERRADEFFFRAAELDFADVLADKNAEASVRQIIRELEASLQPLRSPMVLNGGGFGLTANHSLVMANYLARANAAVINLRELLDQG